MLFQIVLAFERLVTGLKVIQLAHGHDVRRKRLWWGRRSAGICVMLLQFSGLEGNKFSSLSLTN